MENFLDGFLGLDLEGLIGTRCFKIKRSTSDGDIFFKKNCEQISTAAEKLAL